MTTCFSQRDPRWAAERLGTSAETIGSAGCLITCMASILSDFGCDMDPARLNAWLTTHHGYANGNLFVWRSVEPLGAHLHAWHDYYRVPANLERLTSDLSQGRAAVAMVDARPGASIQSHWVRVLDVHGRDCDMMDPWQLPGYELGSLVSRYGAKGWDAARAIFVLATYEQGTSRSVPCGDVLTQNILSIRPAVAE